MMPRVQVALLQGLAEVTRERHGKFGMTLYHLEPNLKEAPGGLARLQCGQLAGPDFCHGQAARLARCQFVARSCAKQLESALDFLMSARCFLHFRHGRDDNTLSWEAQDEAAARKIGASDAEELSAADWMRIYFSHARAVQRTVTQLLEEIPEAWSALVSAGAKLALSPHYMRIFPWSMD